MNSSLRVFLIAIGAAALAGCGDDSDASSETGQLLSGAPSVVVDLDPASGGMSFTIENITARDGVLYVGDRESGNLLRVDPAAPTLAIVGRVADRQDSMGAVVRGNAGGLVFNAAGDLLVATGPFGEVLRVPASALAVTPPSDAVTFATGTQGANALLLDATGNLFVSGGNTGNVYRVGPAGGAAEVWAQIPTNTRSVPPDGFMQAVVSNGMAFAPNGDLLVADTSRGGVWRIAVGADGRAAMPMLWAQDPQLEGIDGIAFDPRGRLWAAVNEQNALAVIGEDGSVTVAHQNDLTGPLEFPAALVFVDDAGYVVNFDRPRRDNLDADGSSEPGIGSSIAMFRL